MNNLLLDLQGSISLPQKYKPMVILWQHSEKNQVKSQLGNKYIQEAQVEIKMTMQYFQKLVHISTVQMKRKDLK